MRGAVPYTAPQPRTSDGSICPCLRGVGKKRCMTEYFCDGCGEQIAAHSEHVIAPPKPDWPNGYELHHNCHLPAAGPQ